LGNTVSFSSSVSSDLINLESKSASVDISISSINTFTASNANTSLNLLTGSLATTGSNTFYGTQLFSGSVFIATDLIVQGSSSIQYISASSVSIGTNIVQLNTATPSVRYAGISVQDSGSSAGITGSMLWDSLCNRWIYSNPSTIGYSGGLLMSGPRASTLGSETTLTCNYIAKSGGGDHLYDSCIIDDGTTVCVNANLKGSGTACFGGNICTPNLSATACINIGTDVSLGSRLSIQSPNDQAGITMYNTYDCNKWSLRTGTTGVNNKGFAIFDDICNSTRIQINSSGYVGIGTCTPSQLLQVYSNIASSSNVTAEFYNGDYNTGTRNFIRLRNGATIGSTTSAYFGQGQDQKTYFYNNDTSRPGDIVITNVGKVGIGISSPVSQLHISSFDCVQTTTLATAYTAAKFRLDTYCGSGQGISMGNVGGYYQYIQGQYSDGVTINPLLLNPYGGNVGIGTGNNAPGGVLDVVTCSNSTQYFYLRNTNNLDASSRSYFYVTAGNTSLSLLALAGGSSCGGTYIAGTCGADMYFQQQAGGAVNMIIKQDGKVGIGTTSPAGLLEIKCAQSTYNRIVSCFEGSYTSGFAFSDLNGGIKYDAGNNVFCIYSTYPNYGGVMIQTGASQRMLITSCGSVNIGTLATGKHNFEIGNIKDGDGGFAHCYFLVPQGVWATFACITDNDANVITDITYVNNNDSNRSGALLARWAYNATCVGTYIVNCAWNWSQNINQFGIRNNGGALQICLGGGANGYRVQARTQGARATG
jgi:hypothetical protein